MLCERPTKKLVCPWGTCTWLWIWYVYSWVYILYHDFHTEPLKYMVVCLMFRAKMGLLSHPWFKQIKYTNHLFSQVAFIPYPTGVLTWKLIIFINWLHRLIMMLLPSNLKVVYKDKLSLIQWIREISTVSSLLYRPQKCTIYSVQICSPLCQKTFISNYHWCISLFSCFLCVYVDLYFASVLFSAMWLYVLK